MRLEAQILLAATLLVNSISTARLSLPQFHNNSQHQRVLERQKRFLVFPGGGTAKFVGGYLGPIDTPLYINCNAIRNLQYQYPLPPNLQWNPMYWPGLNTSGSRSFDSNSVEENQKNFTPDTSRKVAYEVIEEILNREGKNGRECMLRAICEVAETPIDHNGLVGELLQIFFTPGEFEVIHQDYHDAQLAGKNRANCEQIYVDCPLGHGILDSFSLVHEFGFMNWLKF